MDNLISFIDNIREHLNKISIPIAINLPQIVVVGEQSSGKSSVLERIIEREFLPKGSGIVTRCPIVIQLIYSKIDKEYGEFAHKKEKKYLFFNEIREEIIKEMERLVGKSQNLSNKPIFLKIFSNKVINLTLIDLPGLTRIPIGDQNIDIPSKVYEMVSSYVSNPNCLILAIIAANTDIVNSEAIKLIQKYDKELKRTIGVLTKIDIMDNGTNCLSILLNKIVNLKHGWIGLINKMPSNILMSDGIYLKYEEKYFQENITYKNVSYRCGIDYLKNYLNMLLKNHILNCLPLLKQSLKTELYDCEKNLDNLTKYTNSNSNKTNIIIDLLKIYSNNLIECIGISRDKIELDKISNGVHIQNLLINSYEVLIKSILNLSFNNEIQTAIENAYAIPGYIEIPDVVIKSIIKERILLMKPIIDDIVDNIQNIIILSIKSSIDNNSPYPNLNNSILCLVSEFIYKSIISTKKKMLFYLECELNHINLRHPDFSHNTSTQNNKSIISTNNEMYITFIAEVYNVRNKSDKVKFTVSKNSISITLIESNELIGFVYNKDVIIYKPKNFKYSIRMKHKTNKYIIQKIKHLDIQFEDESVLNQWKELFTEKTNMNDTLSVSTINNCSFDLINAEAWKIEKIESLILSYLKVVCKNIHDVLIKTTYYIVISGLEAYIKNKLTVDILSKNQSSLLYLNGNYSSQIKTFQTKKQIISNFIKLIDTSFNDVNREIPN